MTHADIYIIAGDDASALRGTDLVVRLGHSRERVQSIEKASILNGGKVFKDGDHVLRMPGWSRHSDSAVLFLLTDPDAVPAGVSVADLSPGHHPETLKDLDALLAWLDEGSEPQKDSGTGSPRVHGLPRRRPAA